MSGQQFSKEMTSDPDIWYANIMAKVQKRSDKMGNA